MQLSRSTVPRLTLVVALMHRRSSALEEGSMLSVFAIGRQVREGWHLPERRRLEPKCGVPRFDPFPGSFAHLF